MAKKYPTIGSKQAWRTGKKCAICGVPGTNQRIDIQVSWFRGEDEVIHVHADCAKGKNAQALLEAAAQGQRQARIKR